MLERKYDPALEYRYARYGRMSDPKQNKRSPDQQFNTIEETRQRYGYPWQCVASYRDDGISGRFLRKRPNFQRLLRDIEAGLLVIDLIAVDTLERLGRAEEIAELRRKLFAEYGILIVAADNAFCDPTGIVGKAVGMVEQIRATEHTRISRHNVIRGKKDAARLGRWPGGPRPFGYILKPVVEAAVSPPEVFHVLEVEPREAAAQKLAFERAAHTGEGDLRLTRWWNTSPEIPEDFKPLSPFTMGYRLENPIYIGTLRWGANRTGVVNDTRVVEPNPDGAEVLPNFCPPLVSIELFQRVNQLRQIRGEQIQRARTPKTGVDSPAKLITPQARGLTLKYVLSGLVRCGHCQASMRPVPSGSRSKSGKRYRYVHYACPRHYERSCSNRRHVREDQLRAAVLTRLRARLFPLPEQAEQVPSWLPELTALVRQELWRYQEAEPVQTAADQQAVQELERQLAGWSMTLGDPNLPAMVRADFVARYEQAKQRQQQLTQAIARREALQGHVERALDARAVIEQLRHLDEVLAGSNPTVVNLELSKHLEKIESFADGQVEMRGTFVGLFDGAVDLLSREAGKPATTATGVGTFRPVRPRRRGRLRLPSLSADHGAAFGDQDTALDPERFAGLPDILFWRESFRIEPKKCWAAEHASEVARRRATGLTLEELAESFAKTAPTIRHALRLAEAMNPATAALLRRLPRRSWAQEHAAEVLRLHEQGLSLLAIARSLNKSEPTVRKALKHAQAVRGIQPGAGNDSTPEASADDAGSSSSP